MKALWVQADDYEVLYIDGHRVDGGHSVDAGTLLHWMRNKHIHITEITGEAFEEWPDADLESGCNWHDFVDYAKKKHFPEEDRA